MNKKRSKKLFVLFAALLVTGFCLLATMALFGFGLTFWFTNKNSVLVSPQPTSRSFNLVQLPTPPTNTPTPTTTSTSTPTPTPTGTPTPTNTPTPTLLPTDTPPPPPTNTPTSPPLPTPTPTSLPTDTPTPLPPDYPFIIKETDKFDTNHLNFDVYVAITDADNKPLSNYRIIGTHSSGLRIESPVSAGEWTANSGAMHYKAGNIKYEAFNSPSGVWTLQLVDSDGTPVAPPVEFPFDAASPSWYFLLYQRQ